MLFHKILNNQRYRIENIFWFYPISSKLGFLRCFRVLTLTFGIINFILIIQLQ